MFVRAFACFLALIAPAAEADDLFDTKTGLRVARYRAPTPAEAPGALTVNASGAAALIEAGALPVDVFATPTGRWDEIDGDWFVDAPRLSLPGAVWLPEAGRGAAPEVVLRWFAHSLLTETAGDFDRPILVFCVADCWMGWNAAQRVVRLGYRAVHWFPGGVDDWADAGFSLEPVLPRPVLIE